MLSHIWSKPTKLMIFPYFMFSCFVFNAIKIKSSLLPHKKLEQKEKFALVRGTDRRINRHVFDGGEKGVPGGNPRRLYTEHKKIPHSSFLWLKSDSRPSLKSPALHITYPNKHKTSVACHRTEQHRLTAHADLHILLALCISPQLISQRLFCLG